MLGLSFWLAMGGMRAEITERPMESDAPAESWRTPGPHRESAESVRAWNATTVSDGPDVVEPTLSARHLCRRAGPVKRRPASSLTGATPRHRDSRSGYAFSPVSTGDLLAFWPRQRVPSGGCSMVQQLPEPRRRLRQTRGRDHHRPKRWPAPHDHHHTDLPHRGSCPEPAC